MGVNRLMCIVENFVVYIDGKMAQNVGMAGKYCSVILILFGWFWEFLLTCACFCSENFVTCSSSTEGTIYMETPERTGFSCRSQMLGSFETLHATKAASISRFLS